MLFQLVLLSLFLGAYVPSLNFISEKAFSGYLVLKQFSFSGLYM